jgi:hypothetical protein
MTIQLAVSTRNARLDAIETDIGVSAVVKIRTGAQPANCAAADSGTVLVSWTLAADWASAAAAGSKAFTGTPIGTTAAAAGAIGHYRVYASDGTTCKMQGSAGTSGTDMITDAASTSIGQAVNITSWSMIDGNA